MSPSVKAITCFDRAAAIRERKQKVVNSKRRIVKEKKKIVDDLNHQLKMQNLRQYYQKQEEEKRKESYKNEMTDFCFMSVFFLKEVDNASNAMNEIGKNMLRDLSFRLQLHLENKSDAIERALCVSEKFLAKNKPVMTRRKSIAIMNLVDPTEQALKLVTATFTNTANDASQTVNAIERSKDNNKPALVLTKTDLYDKQSRLPKV